MKKSRIAFWIVFPILTAIFTAIILFIYDLTNGPLTLFVFQLIIIGFFVASTVLIRNLRIWYRLIPVGALLAITTLLLALSRPAIELRPSVLHANPKETETPVVLNEGKINGVYTEDEKVIVYTGIPYAAPPVGDLRRRPPQDPLPWEGIKSSFYFEPKAMQTADNSITNTLVDMYAEGGWHPDYISHSVEKCSEDCLYLNVWKPNVEETNLPVLVYIHGGSLSTGSPSFYAYNGENMARTGVIQVNIAYRLNVFGYFAHEQLIEESKSIAIPTGTTGNYGLLDQIKALHWIKENISRFGGDPNNITICGESAGSSSVSALCVSPLNEVGLFERAIGESSSIVGKNPPHTFRKLDKALEVGNDIMNEFSCKNVNELRQIPAERLVNTKYKNQEMTIDGYALNKLPYESYLNGENIEKALLNGGNAKEADAFVVPQYLFSGQTNCGNILDRLADHFKDRDAAQRMLDLFEYHNDTEAFRLFNDIIGVEWFLYPHYQWSKLVENQGKPVYKYFFSKENGYYGSYHSGELVYAFGNYNRYGPSFRYNESDAALSKAMITYWSNFVKTGNPNSSDDSLVQWNTWNSVDNKLFNLDKEIKYIDDRFQGLYSILDELDEKKLAEAV